jgi:ABC-type lipoprotein export system ATPase subunit
VEWSGGEQQRVVIDRTLVDGTKAAQDFVSQLDEAPRNVRFGSLADIAAALPNVRFTPESGHR